MSGSDADPVQDPARAALVGGAEALGIELGPEQARTLLAYLDAMLAENLKVNLTSIRDRDQAVVFHLLDSLTVAAAWREVTGTAAPRRLLDLGTGGGFPGAPLAVLWPRTQALLLDGTAKKVRAVETCLQAAGIRNARAQQCRVEQLVGLQPEMAGQFDLVVARAVGRVAGILENSRRTVARGGYVLAMKGPEPPQDEISEARETAGRLGFEPPVVHTAAVPGLDPRKLFLFRRVR